MLLGFQPNLISVTNTNVRVTLIPTHTNSIKESRWVLMVSIMAKVTRKSDGPWVGVVHQILGHLVRRVLWPPIGCHLKKLRHIIKVIRIEFATLAMTCFAFHCSKTM